MIARNRYVLDTVFSECVGHHHGLFCGDVVVLLPLAVRRPLWLTVCIGIEIGCEDDEHVERHLELLSGVQGQVVHAALERHDSPFE